MQPIIQYLLNTILLSMCGAFEEKVETCKYFCAGIDSVCRYDFLKKTSKSEYTASNISDIISEFKKILYIGNGSDVCLKNNHENNNTKRIFIEIYDDYKDYVKNEIESIIQNTEFEQHLKNEFLHI